MTTRVDPAMAQDSLEELRRRLAEAEETLRAIRNGEVDAVVVAAPHGERVYTLETADRPYRTFVDEMGQGAVALSADLLVLFCNAAFAQIVGAERIEVAGRSLMEFVSPADREGLEEWFTNTRWGRRQREITLLRRDGESAPVLLTANATSGEDTAFGLVVTDLTLQRERDELVATDRRKNEFLAMLAHELRNPLAPIRNAVQILRTPGLSAADLEWSRELIDRQVQHLSRMVDDLLDLSRITRGQIVLIRERVALADVIASAIETARPQIDELGHALEVAAAAEPLELDADIARLSQVIANLLNNAAKFTPAGGRIRIESKRDGDAAVVKVMDSGVGIDADVLPRIFDLFVQGDASSEALNNGLGIGLTVVRTLVEMHGGSVTVRSAKGEGSEFELRLPLATAGATAAAAPERPAQPPASVARRVLVVEDNVDAAESLAVLLDFRGHQTRTAFDGQAALEIARVFRPEIVLLDIGVPKLDGYEVARRLRAVEETRHAMLVALTGYGQEEDRALAKAAGFDHHFTKPMSPVALYGLIDALPAPERRT